MRNEIHFRVSKMAEFTLFPSLPKELQLLILFNCPYRTLYQYAKTSKAARDTLEKDDLFWERKTIEDYGHIWTIETLTKKRVKVYHRYRQECWNRLCMPKYCSRYPKVFRKLLTVDFDLNQLDEDGDTPLICAYWGNQPGVMEELLQAGADPNIRMITGNPILVEACSDEDLDAIQESEVLLGAGADPNLPDKKGHTPLMHACRRQNPMLASLLLEYGADFYNVNLEHVFDIVYELGYPESMRGEMLRLFSMFADS